MAKNTCSVCGQKFHIERKEKDRKVCDFCAALSPQGASDTVDNISRYYQTMCQRGKTFNTTKKLKAIMGRTVYIDEKNQLFYVENNKIPFQIIYRFDEIVSYSKEVVGQKEVTKTKGGFGRAVAGGLIAGPAGAIIGASTAKQETTLTGGTAILTVKTVLFDGDRGFCLTSIPYGFELFLDNCIKLHNEKISKEANNSETTTISAADELLKFKQLLDAGVITQEEFDAQKQKLLNL